MTSAIGPSSKVALSFLPETAITINNDMKIDNSGTKYDGFITLSQSIRWGKDTYTVRLYVDETKVQSSNLINDREIQNQMKNTIEKMVGLSIAYDIGKESKRNKGTVIGLSLSQDQQNISKYIKQNENEKILSPPINLENSLKNKHSKYENELKSLPPKNNIELLTPNEEKMYLRLQSIKWVENKIFGAEKNTLSHQSNNKQKKELKFKDTNTDKGVEKLDNKIKKESVNKKNLGKDNSSGSPNFQNKESEEIKLYTEFLDKLDEIEKRYNKINEEIPENSILKDLNEIRKQINDTKEKRVSFNEDNGRKSISYIESAIKYHEGLLKNKNERKASNSPPVLPNSTHSNTDFHTKKVVENIPNSKKSIKDGNVTTLQPQDIQMLASDSTIIPPIPQRGHHFNFGEILLEEIVEEADLGSSVTSNQNFTAAPSSLLKKGEDTSAYSNSITKKDSVKEMERNPLNPFLREAEIKEKYYKILDQLFEKFALIYKEVWGNKKYLKPEFEIKLNRIKERITELQDNLAKSITTYQKKEKEFIAEHNVHPEIAADLITKKPKNPKALAAIELLNSRIDFLAQSLLTEMEMLEQEKLAFDKQNKQIK